MNKEKILIDYTYTIIGSFILALGTNFFLVPIKISTGGISGIATILFYVFKIPISVTTLILNLVLFICGYKILNKDSIIKTLTGIVFHDYTIMFYSVLSLYISTKVTDIILVRGDFAKSGYIISEYSEEIAGKIMSGLERGVTELYIGQREC